MSPETPQPYVEQPLAKIGVFLVMLHVFINFGRFQEFLAGRLGARMHLALLVGVLALVVLPLVGGVERLFTLRPTVLMLAFTAWLMAVTPFSIWRGGSFDLLRGQWLVAILTCVVVSGMTVSLAQCYNVMKAIAYATLFVLVMASLFGSDQSQNRDLGRFGIEGTLRNSNDLATVLLIGAPFCMLLAMRKGLSPGKVLGIAGCGLSMLFILRTGSRAGLVAVVVLVFLIFLKATFIKKIMLAVVVFALAVGGMSLTTQATRDRYRTLFSGDEEVTSAAGLSARDSQAGRKRLIEAALYTTMQHPLTGIGPGMFTVYISGNSMRSFHMQWTEVHNTALQISGETGIAGLLIYGAAVVLCFRRISAVRKAVRNHDELKHIADMGFCMFLSLWAWLIMAMFGPNAYYFHFPMLAGLTAVFDRAAWAEIGASQPLAAVAAMGPVPARAGWQAARPPRGTAVIQP